jgi:hypothetical protein
MPKIEFTFVKPCKFNSQFLVLSCFGQQCTKIILYLSLLALLDMVIPIPFTALMLIYVIFEKPAWFRNIVTEIYNSF